MIPVALLHAVKRFRDAIIVRFVFAVLVQMQLCNTSKTLRATLSLSTYLLFAKSETVKRTLQADTTPAPTIETVGETIAPSPGPVSATVAPSDPPSAWFEPQGNDTSGDFADQQWSSSNGTHDTAYQVRTGAAVYWDNDAMVGCFLFFFLHSLLFFLGGGLEKRLVHTQVS